MNHRRPAVHGPSLSRHAHAPPRAPHAERTLGELLQTFVSRVTHPRGVGLTMMADASVTLPQVILLKFAAAAPHSTLSGLATSMNVSLPSVSQMVERLVALELVQRTEDPTDRRRKTLTVTPRARLLVNRLREARNREFSEGTAALSPATRQRLCDALALALDELGAAEAAPATIQPPG